MRTSIFSRPAVLFAVFALFLSGLAGVGEAQSRPQRPTQTNVKKNNRAAPKTPEQIEKEKEAAAQAEADRTAIVDDEVLEFNTAVVNIDVVVYEKKTGRIVTGLTKKNFTVYEEGEEQKITNFSIPDVPITVTLVVEYSRWSEIFGSASGGRFEAGHYEAIRPVAQFVSNFIKPPNDYASIIAFDSRPTPITDFTNDPNRLRSSINLLLRNRPAFRENNLFDAINFALVGGRADSVVLEDSEERKQEYSGMVDVRTGRRAIIVVASGIDTFSKLNYDEIRKTIQQSGIPIFLISTANLFYKKYEHRLDARDSISGFPGRLTFLQARNQMNVFARDSGGAHFAMTFPGEIPSYLQSIDAMLRNQYSLAYDARPDLEPGKKYKLKVSVDVNNDGKFDDKKYKIQHRTYFRAADDDKDKEKN